MMNQNKPALGSVPNGLSSCLPGWPDRQSRYPSFSASTFCCTLDEHEFLVSQSNDYQKRKFFADASILPSITRTKCAGFGLRVKSSL
jgi:hypothetical protein